MPTPPPLTNVVSISTPPTVVRRRPGRPKQVRPEPALTHDERDYVERLSREADAFVDGDPIVGTFKDYTTDKVRRVEAVLHGLAQEQAALLFDRLHQQREQRTDPDPAMLSSRRVDCLTKMARLALDLEILKRASGTMNDETVLKLVHMLTDAAVSVVHEVATPTQAAEFETSLRGQVEAASWSVG